MNYEDLDVDRGQQDYEMGNQFDNQFEVQTMKESTVPTVSKYLDFIVKSVETGNANALEMFTVVKTLEKLFSDAKTKIDGYAIEEAEKYGAKSFDAFGIRFELRDGARRFDFKNIKEWQVANENLKSIEEKYKLAWQNKEKGLMSVTEDGEVMEMPIVNVGKSSLISKIKK